MLKFGHQKLLGGRAELTALPQTPSWIKGQGKMGIHDGRTERGRREGKDWGRDLLHYL